MRSFSLLAICCLLLGVPASAQFDYTFKAGTAAYAPLATSTSLSGTQVWGSDAEFTLPLGFSFKMNGVTTQNMYVTGSFVHPVRAAKQTGFVIIGTGLVDRGTLQGGVKSPVRYATSGAAGSRIFKLEFFNAGFEEEGIIYNEQKDSLNLQVWFYEGSNAVEIRYGGSVVSHFQDYFGPRIMTGYVKNADMSGATFDKFYLLNGAPAAPTIDSTTNIITTKGLTAVPASGTVYRFTPKGATATGLEQVAAGTLAGIFPTRSQGAVQIRNTTTTTLQTELYGMDGRLAQRTDIRPGTASLDLSTLPAGPYIIRLTDTEKGRTESQRIEKL